MRNYLQPLPKLAVSAKLICLLMVVSCGTVTSMVRYVKLYNECAHSFLMIQNSGLVLADPDIHNSPYQNLTVISAGFSPNLTIYNRESRRYLCFTQKWRLFGSVRKRDRGEMCQFREELVKEGSYTRYRSAADPSYLVGFTRAGKAIQWWSRGRRLRPSQRCLSFIKVLDIIRNLLKLNESDSKDNAQGSPVFIQLTKRNPITVASKMIRFPVAHSLISENSSVCMIVKDVTDGSEDSVKSVKEKLKSSGIKNVKEVMTLNKFLQVCQSDKNNLCNKFDYFLIDSSISHRSNSRKLRRFSSQLKFPIPVRLYGVKNIKPEVEKGLAKTIAVVTKTPTTTFKIGFTSMTPHQIRDNVYAVWSNLDRLFPGGTANISAAAVKLADSKALSFYVPVLSIQLPKEVTMSTEMMVWKKGQESPTKSSENLNAEKKRAGTEKKLTKNQKKKLKRKARALEKKGSTPNGVEEHKTNATTSENDEFIARSKATRPKVVTKPYEKFSSSSSDEYLELSDGGEEFSGDDVDQFLDLEAEESSCDEETDDKDEESLSDSDVDEELDEDIFDGSSDSESDEEGDESDNEVTASISPKSMKKIINTVPAALKKGKQGANKKFESNGKKKPFMKKAQNAKGLHQNTKRSPQQFGKKKKGKSPMK